MTDINDGDAETLADQEQRIEALERQIAIERTSRITGVPPDLLGNGTTAEEIERIAADLLGWRAAAAASRPQTAAVSASVVTSGDRIEMPHQLTTHDELRRLSPAERMRALREGRLIHLGANPPPPRRIGISGSPTQQAP
jgi:hypothetical protein